jgi:hypothetical protein
MNDGEGGVVQILTGLPKKPLGPYVRIRLEVDEQWEMRDFTLADARLLWWALGAACDFVSEREDD